VLATGHRVVEDQFRSLVSNRDKYVSQFCIPNAFKDLVAMRIFTDLFVDPFWNYIPR